MARSGPGRALRSHSRYVPVGMGDTSLARLGQALPDWWPEVRHRHAPIDGRVPGGAPAPPPCRPATRALT